MPRIFGAAIAHAHGGFFYLASVTFILCLMLGGGTRGGFLSDTVLQFLSLPLLVTALWRLCDLPKSQDRRCVLWLVGAVLFLPLLQLVPLPPAIWSALPGRAAAVEAFGLAGHDLGWMPISLSPAGTWLALLGLVPPLAVFLGTLLLTYPERRLLSLVFLAAAFFSAVLGLLQLAQGPSSALRFFAFTNVADPVGFFANRNHFAALLYSGVVFAVAWALDAAGRIQQSRKARRPTTEGLVLLIAAATVLTVLICVQLMTRSRAGLGLTVFAIAGASALFFARPKAGAWLTPSRLVLSVVLAAGALSSQVVFHGIIARFAADPVEDGRLRYARTTIEAAWANLPFGTGVGSFVPVYAGVEQPADLIANVFVNHAHNDLLEFWLEGGVLSAALVAAWAGWLAFKLLTVWNPRVAWGQEDIDGSLARAAILLLLLLAAHSVVDYPLRTSAVMSVMAMACAFLVEAPEENSARRLRSRDRPLERGDGGTTRRSPQALGRPAAAAAGPVMPRPPNIVWPDSTEEARPRQRPERSPPLDRDFS
ncbi:O-antigen ligase family protein [Aquabacter spiritensis]|nr:O-antigen ligase family protein [Aquabacter spiritensis]